MKNRLSFTNTTPNTKKQASFGLNAGSSSIILIFVILCMISFATLSIISSNADRKLSLKVLERTESYYLACNDVEESLAKLDTNLKATLDELLSSSEYNDLETSLEALGNDYFDIVGHNVSYTVPITDSQALFVEVAIIFPLTSIDNFYKITAWHIITTKSDTITIID